MYIKRKMKNDNLFTSLNYQNITDTHNPTFPIFMFWIHIMQEILNMTLIWQNK